MPALNIDIEAKFAQFLDSLDTIERHTRKTAKTMGAAFSGLKTILGTLGVGLSVAGLANMVKGSIESVDALRKLNLQTGISVETLSALKGVAKQAGTDLESVAGLVNKLQNNMLSFAQDGGGKAANAFKQLGYSQEQVKAGLQNMNTFLPEFAKRLISAGVGGEQAGLAMQLMAKGGAAALPFLKELAENGALVAKVTGEQADAAHRFEVSMAKLSAQSESFKRSIVNELLPSLNAITQSMLDAKKAGEGFLSSLAEGAKTAIQIMAGWNTKGDLNKINKQITELTATWLEFENAQEKGRRSSARQVQMDRLRTEIDLLIKKRDGLEQILKMEQPEKKEPPLARQPLKDLPLARQPSKDRTAEYERDARAIVDAEARAAQEVTEAWQAWEKIQLAHHKEMTDAWALQWKQVFEEIDADQQRAIDEGKAYLDALAKEAKENDNIFKELGLTFSSAFGKLIIAGGTAGDVMRSLAQDVIQLIAKIAILEPLAENMRKIFKDMGGGNTAQSLLSKLFGGGSSSGGGVFGGDFDGTSYATGTSFVPRTGLAMLHRGERVIPADQNSGMGATFNITYNPTGDGGAADAQTMAATLIPLVKSVVRGEITTQLRPGGALA